MVSGATIAPMNHERVIRSAIVMPGESEGKIIARVLTYGTVDDYGTTFRRGVFNDSLNQRMPSMAWSHDWADVIGRWTGYSDTEEGLILEGQLDDFDAVPRARQAWAQLQSGSMSQFSVGFIPGDAEFIVKDGDEVLEFRSGRLDEVSVVMVGAVPGTQLLAMRDNRGVDLMDVRVQARFSSEQRETRAVAVDLDELANTLLEVQAGDLTAEEAATLLSVAAESLGLEDAELEAELDEDGYYELAQLADDGNTEAADTLTEWAEAAGVDPTDDLTWLEVVELVLVGELEAAPVPDADEGELLEEDESDTGAVAEAQGTVADVEDHLVDPSDAELEADLEAALDLVASL